MQDYHVIASTESKVVDEQFILFGMNSAHPDSFEYNGPNKLIHG